MHIHLSHTGDVKGGGAVHEVNSPENQSKFDNDGMVFPNKLSDQY